VQQLHARFGESVERRVAAAIEGERRLPLGIGALVAHPIGDDVIDEMPAAPPALTVTEPELQQRRSAAQRDIGGDERRRMELRPGRSARGVGKMRDEMARALRRRGEDDALAEDAMKAVILEIDDVRAPRRRLDP
jgi:hypothetical protein